MRPGITAHLPGASKTVTMTIYSAVHPTWREWLRNGQLLPVLCVTQNVCRAHSMKSGMHDSLSSSNTSASAYCCGNKVLVQHGARMQSNLCCISTAWQKSHPQLSSGKVYVVCLPCVSPLAKYLPPCGLRAGGQAAPGVGVSDYPVVLRWATSWSTSQQEPYGLTPDDTNTQMDFSACPSLLAMIMADHMIMRGWHTCQCWTLLYRI